MADEENTLVLTATQHDKLGIIHCGVTRKGFIAVGGEPRDIADGEEILFERSGVKAARKGDDYIFTRE